MCEREREREISVCECAKNVRETDGVGRDLLCARETEACDENV